MIHWLLVVFLMFIAYSCGKDVGREEVRNDSN